jgi:hypothetical protein
MTAAHQLSWKGGMVMSYRILVTAGSVLGVLALQVPGAAGAESGRSLADTTKITAQVKVRGDKRPPEFTVVVDPDPSDPSAKLQFLRQTARKSYRLDAVPPLAGRGEIYLVSPPEYRVYNPVAAQYAPLTRGDTTLTFKLRRQKPHSQARSLAFWKHQVNLHIKGDGGGEETPEDLVDTYPSRIHSGFPPGTLAGAAVEPLNLAGLHRTFAVTGRKDHLAQARQEYLTLLLNTASGRLDRYQPIADDGATVNDAIRYLNVLVQDDHEKNDDDAADIARRINEARDVDSGKVPPCCLAPVTAWVDSGQEIRVLRHDGKELQGRVSGLALDKDLLTMNVTSGDGERPVEIPASQITRIQYEEPGKVTAGGVMAGVLLGLVGGLYVGSKLIDEDAGKGQFFYVPPEPFVGAGIGALIGALGGAAISALPDTRTIECEDGLAQQKPR